MDRKEIDYESVDEVPQQDTGGNQHTEKKQESELALWTIAAIAVIVAAVAVTLILI